MMGPLLVGLIIAQTKTGTNKPLDQDPEYLKIRGAANTKFRNIVNKAKTISFDMDIKQANNPVQGHATFVLQRPENLYFHLTWGKAAYTYTILNGRATEVDTANKVYDEYDVPQLSPPQANGSDWAASFFPTAFVSDQVLLPPKFFDSKTGLIAKYAIGSSDGQTTRVNALTFSGYKIDEPMPETTFVVHPPAGFSAYSVPDSGPPYQIGEMLPDLHLKSASGQATDLKSAISRKPALVALLDPNCGPSVASLKVLRATTSIPVVVLNASPNGRGLDTGSLRACYDPAGNLEKSLRAPMTPLFYLVDGSGKVTNVWYGFDRDAPEKFSKQISEAVVEQQSGDSGG